MTAMSGGQLSRIVNRRVVGAFVVGGLGVVAGQLAATVAGVGLPILLATGLSGALICPGWTGPVAMWLGAMTGEAVLTGYWLLGSGFADPNGFAPAVLFIGAGLFILVFGLTAVLVEGARRLAPRLGPRIVIVGILVLAGAGAIGLFASLARQPG